MKKYSDIYPDEIFLDSQNLPSFDLHQFEGRLEKPIQARNFIIFGGLCLLIMFVFVFRMLDLEILNGKTYAEKSENNSLQNSTIFAGRGIIYDRNTTPLAWNDSSENNSPFPTRNYIDKNGFGHLLGFIKYPALDSSGFYYRRNYEPEDGIELFLNGLLTGKNGLKITETDVAGKVISESLVDKEEPGKNTTLSIDSRIQAKLYQEIALASERVGFQGGAGIIMDLRTGEIIAMTDFPDYDSTVMTAGTPTETIKSYGTNPNMPFLNRAVSGLYTPGSIIKPFVAFGALEEKIISPEKEIVTNGKLVVPNPYFKDKPSIFLDWRNNGTLDMRHAIGFSSDVYFYEIGGGFGDQKGLGILNIEKYLQKFGFGSPTNIGITGESVGNIPDPTWKEKVFGEPWLLGDTYHSAIGQYGMQVTPIQVVRAIGAMGNGGTLLTPTFLKQATTTTVLATGKKIPGDPEHYKVVQEGMRLSVKEGTSVGLNVPYVQIAGKTGTAELGALKQFVNSWTVGFFPYENPHYAYTIVMEKGPVHNLIGATAVMRTLIDWMHENTPEYFE